ncbi:MAG TPA: benzoate-CoA ligase family protein, partial [Byssovorax sp.]
MTDPAIDVPRDYNAATALLEGNLAAGRGAKVAVRDGFGAHTYAELAARVERTAAALQAVGVEPEQRVLLCLLDTIDFHACFLGAMRLGAVPVPVNTMLTTKDFEHMLVDSRARVLVVSDALVEKVAPAAARSPHLRRVVVAPSPTGGDAAGLDRLEALVAAAPSSCAPARTTCDDVAFWLYSSGSTGKPKGAMHLHASLPRTAALYARGVLGLAEDDVVLSAAKLFFAYGLGNALTFPLSVGATSVLLADRPTPHAIMGALATHQPTVFCGVPTLFASVLADPKHDRATGSRALRVCTSAGEALPRHVGEAWRARMGADILDGIGSTEMLHIFLSNRPGDVRYGTTGLPVPGYDVELRDERGGPVADGEEGALWVKGPTACVAYWNERDKSLAAFHGPWTRTGDTYVRGADGAYTYAGRSDDMLKVGGIWVSPFEVESALGAHDAVLEVAVVGHEDADGLVKPKAFVVLKDAAAASDALAIEL